MITVQIVARAAIEFEHSHCLLHLYACASSLNNIWKSQFGIDLRDTPGAGAAGGLAAGLMAFCRATTMRSGFDLVAEQMGLEKEIANANLVMTGEGQIDGSTAAGKVPTGVARLCAKHRVPLIAIVGGIKGDVSRLHQDGISAIFSIAPGPITLEKSKQDAVQLIQRACEEVMRLWLIASASGSQRPP